MAAALDTHQEIAQVPGRHVPDSIVALFQREKVTLSHCVPTILRMLLDSAKTKGISLSGWKILIGGAALPQALAREADGSLEGKRSLTGSSSPTVAGFRAGWLFLFQLIFRDQVP
jgi:non-ribosomal peptide synthetase component F